MWIARKVDLYRLLAAPDRLPACIAPGLGRAAALENSVERHSLSPMLECDCRDATSAADEIVAHGDTALQ